MNKLLIVCMLVLVACSSKEPTKVQSVEVRTIEVQRPAPIVPAPDQLDLKEYRIHILTKENIDEKFNENSVYYALTEDGYKALSSNLADLRLFIDQQTSIIQVYKRSYERN